VRSIAIKIFSVKNRVEHICETRDYTRAWQGIPAIPIITG